MSYCAGRAGIEANAATSADNMLARSIVKPGNADNAQQKTTTNDVVPEKRKPDNDETTSGLKRRRYNAGITEEELGT